MNGTDRILLSAGDVDQDSAVLWARASAVGPMRFEVSTDPDFSRPLAAEVVVVTDPLVPAKLPLADGTLMAGTRYYWRATDADGAAGAATFVTAAPEGARAGFHLGVSGDWRGELSPYPAITNADERGLDLFVKLGDTAYADFPSAAVPEAQATTLEQFRLKHLEGYSGHADLDAWNDLQKSTAILSVIDDHEVTDNFAGGVPVPAGEEALYGAAAPTLVNDSPLFENGLRAFQDYNAIEERRLAETGDERTAGEWDLYRYGVHGADAAVFLLDERSFRDAALRPWAFTPADTARFLGEAETLPRTLLGSTQLARLQADLLDAEARGVTWKFVLTPAPIQNLGPGDAQDRYEGYAFERNALLQFIDERDIENVVFIAADLHATTTNNLTYQMLGADGLGPQVALPAFEVITGPVAFDPPFGSLVVEGAAAFGLLSPEQLALYRSLPVPAKETFFQEVINGQLDLFGYDRLGLADNLDQAQGLLQATLTAGDWTATHTYGWSEFVTDQITGALTVRTWGVPAYGEAEATDPAVAGGTPAIVSEFTVEPARAIEFSVARGGDPMAALLYENQALPGHLQDSASLTDTTGTDLARFQQAGGDVDIRRVELASGFAVGDGTAPVVTLDWTGNGTALLRQEVTRGALDTLRVEDFTGTSLRVEGFTVVDLRLDRPGGVAVQVGEAREGVIVTGAGDDAITVHTAGKGAPYGTAFALQAGSGDDTIIGGRSADTIDGGPGADNLTGGGGGDVFVLRAGEVAGDVIHDFAAAPAHRGHDLLRVAGFDIGATLAELGGTIGDIGNVIRDFLTAHASRGQDQLRFEGFGNDAALVNAGGDTWTIGGETFRLVGVTAIGPGDYLLT